MVGLSDNVYVSSLSYLDGSKAKSKDKHIKRKLALRNASYVESEFSFVRLRKKPEESWVSELHGDAIDAKTFLNQLNAS